MRLDCVNLVKAVCIGCLVAFLSPGTVAGQTESSARPERLIRQLSELDFAWHEERWYERVGLGDGLRNVAEDYRQFWGLDSRQSLLLGVGAAGIMAATPGDREVQRWYRRDVASERLENIADVVERPGEWLYTVPAFAGLALLSPAVSRDSFVYPATAWGSRSLRAMLVGAPPVGVLQRLLGAQRPREGDGVTRWRPFKNDNGVSGHAFAGAVPFLTAAQMAHSPWARYPLMAASMLPAWARLNNDDHSLSQVALGWYIAYLATAAVDRSDGVRGGWVCTPVLRSDAHGLALVREF